jgi:hypothetical protein
MAPEWHSAGRKPLTLATSRRARRGVVRRPIAMILTRKIPRDTGERRTRLERGIAAAIRDFEERRECCDADPGYLQHRWNRE